MNDDTNGNGSRRPTTTKARLARREQQARERGYVGDEWPPPRAEIDTPDNWHGYLSRVQGGERRAGFLHALARTMTTFYLALEPADFRRFADQLVTIALDEKTAPRTRLRAIEGLVRPLSDGAQLLESLMRLEHRPEMTEHLERCLAGFFEGLNRRKLTDVADVLKQLARTQDASAVRAIGLALRLITNLAQTLAGLQAARRRDPPDDPELTALAEAELKEIEAEVLDDRPPRRVSPPPGDDPERRENVE